MSFIAPSALLLSRAMSHSRKSTPTTAESRRVMAHITSPGGEQQQRDPVDGARKLLRSLQGATPAMGQVSTMLRVYRHREIEVRREVDALTILARERGLSWAAIGGLLHQTPSAAR